MNSKTKALFVFLIILLTQISFSQQKQIDSLLLLLENHSKNDSIKVNLYNDLAFENLKIDLKKANIYSSNAKKIAKEINYIKGEARNLYIQAVIHLYKGETNNAIKIINHSILLYSKTSDYEGLAKSYDLSGTVFYYLKKYEKAKLSFEKALKLAKKINNKTLIANFSTNLSNYYKRKNDYNKAKKFLSSAIHLYDSLGKNHKVSGALNNLAIINKEEGNYFLALQNLKKTLSIEESNNHKLSIPKTLINIGVIYSELKQYNKSTPYFLNALKSYEKNDNKKQISNCYLNLGSVKMNQKQYTEAIDYFNKALEINKKLNDKEGVYYNHINLGKLFLDTKKLQKSILNLNIALDLSRNLNNDNFKCNSLIELSKALLLIKDYKKSFIYLNEAKKIASKLKLTKELKESHKLLSQIYVFKKNYKKAYENQIQYKKLSDSLFNKETIRKISELEAEYKYKNELEIAELKEKQLTQKVEVTTNDLKKSKQKIFIGIIVFLSSLLILGIALFYLKLRNIKAINQNIITEQRLLRTQMSPHFIFNALAVLQGIIISKEEEKSISYLSKFSKLLRTTLENSRDDLVELGKELLVIKNYIDLQNIDNNKNPIHYTINIDDTIDEAKTLIPPMLIQPFIENAIEHGFTSIQTDKNLTINIELIDESLKCTITDNGKGFIDKQNNNTQNKKSLSTKITKERLGIISKKHNHKSNIEVFNTQKGVTIILTLPFLQ